MLETCQRCFSLPKALFEEVSVIEKQAASVLHTSNCVPVYFGIADLSWCTSPSTTFLPTAEFIYIQNYLYIVSVYL